ncbi:type 2 lanthipeptide synthetase LanM [Streptomyces yerevanensis]|uniref:type 2 lanthipeptide synthetase LanM n=1 Tax=Streptomyces yerevanensis TaxID=66378 RepID=UPI0005274749|nr:type 2 lanthipeptide synthetase LanM [Streptomyces yerevanensis]
MISPARYYPEFDSVEVEETIVPLAEFDQEIAAVLRTYGSAPAAAADSGAGTRATVEEWLGRPERYSFQRVVRAVAATLAAPDPVAPFEELFREPRAVLIQLLERAEARLREVYTRPLVAAVNHAREKGLLVGADTAERYAYFVDRSTLTSFEEVSGLSFPVLREVTRTLLRHEAAGFAEFCGRLVADREALAARFGIDVTDPVASFSFSEGDAHHHGRSVSVVEFHSGTRLVYKPRDVSGESAYETLAREVNSRFGTSLVAAKVLERDRYGYVEFIDAEDVSGMSEEFLHASGELAAVLYLLNARDMHVENIVPTRRGPVPVDLETILHPERIHVGSTPQARGNGYEAMGQSVYGIGILPLVMVGKGEDSGHVDLGFLGEQGRGPSPFKAMRFEEPFTDRVRLLFQAQEAQERRTVVEALTKDETYVLGDRMASGFTRVCRAVMADRESWAELLHSVAARVRVRYVHNPTALYAQTLRMTSSANALDDFSIQLALLKRIAIASKTSSREIVRSEMRQLAERDIPYFTVAAAGTTLEDGDGVPVGAEFDESPLGLALAKSARLSEFELGEQLRLIHSAFASRFPDNHLTAAVGTDRVPAADLPPVSREGGPDEALTALAAELCDHLVATSLPDRFAHLPRTWIGPLASAQANRPWPPAVLGYDLYTGRVGPALALAAAGRALDRGEYRDLAEQVFAPAADILADHRYETRSIRQAGFGGYTGLAGTLLALSAAGRLLGRHEWAGAAQGALPLVLAQVHEQPPDRVPLDVVGGLAGVMSCVAAIGGPHADDSLAALASLLTDALRGAGRRPGPGPSVLGQSGFAHGISGVVHALSRVHPLLAPEQRDGVEETLTGLVSRLTDFYDREEGNWFSNVDTPKSFSTGWCHGSTGVALALSAYGSLARSGDDGSGAEAVLRMRDVAVGNMLRLGFGRNLTWCHGDLGNHDVLWELAAAGDARLHDEIAAIEQTWLRPEVFRRKIHDRKSRYAHTNSLMVGTAGIVLHLVNRMDPALRISPVTLTIGGR